MSEIFVSPDEMTLEAPEGTTLLEVAVDAGIPIAHLCGGRARCSTCRVRIVAGLDVLSARTDKEAVMAERLDFPDEVRLACQTRALGDVRLWRLVLDRLDIEMASQLGEGHYVGPVGREVDVAVLFLDVAGFTAMSEMLPPYDVVHILNRFFNRVGDAVEANRGRIDNYMGDGMLAIFGIDEDDHEDYALSAVRAGLDALAVAADMHRYVSRVYRCDFNIRVGIGLGEVIFGLMGSESSARETVVGDVVNTASRLEAANKRTGTTMLVTESVHRRTSDAVVYGEPLELDLAGKDGQVVAYPALGLVGAGADALP
jgi:class 3 adenylate cyclase